MNSKLNIKYFYIVMFVVASFLTYFLFRNSYALDYDEDWYTDYTYTTNNSDKTITLTKYNGTDTEVYVPSTAVIDSEEYSVIVVGGTKESALFNGNTNITKVTFENGVKAGNKLSYLFFECSNLREIVFNDFDTSATTSMFAMFGYCRNLVSLDLSSFDTSNVTNMGYLFEYCEKLTSLDLSNFNTSSVTTMYYMFTHCRALTSLNISSFDTSNVTSMAYMFSYCDSLTSLDVSSFNTSNVTSMAYMFAYCEKLVNLDLSNFNTSNVTTMIAMFHTCSNLTTLNVSSFNTSNVTTLRHIFQNCSKLKELDLTGFDTTSATDMYYMFYHVKLDKITFGSKFDFKYGEILNTYPFGRGIWKKQNGNFVNAVDLVLRSSTENISGTYTRESNIVNEMNIDYPVTYRINRMSKIDEFTTTNENNFAISSTNKSVYIKNLRPTAESATVNGYTVDGSVTMLFKDIVVDGDGEKYDLQVKLDNIRLFDIDNDEADGDSFICSIANITSNVLYLQNSFKTRDLSNDIYSEAAIKQDVTFKIIDSNGNVKDGSFLFSVADLDIPTVKNFGELPAYLTASGEAKFGYGDYSEGVNLISGYDFSTLKTYPQNQLVVNNETHRIFGKHIDENTEFTEFSIKADASNLKFTWTCGAHCETAVLQNYQPQIVSLAKRDINGDIISGVELKLYKGDSTTPMKTWITTNTDEKVFLTPGRYTLKETSAPTGYIKANDLVFYVDIDDTLTINGANVDSISLVNNFNKYNYTVNYYDKETNEKIYNSKTSEANYKTIITALDEAISIDGYTYKEAKNKDGTIVNNIVIDHSSSNNVINLYYELKKTNVIIKYIDRVTGEEIIPDATSSGHIGDNYNLEEYQRNLENMDYYYDDSLGDIEGTYTDEDKTLIFYYRKKYNVTVKVQGSGGTVEGNEKVFEGEDSRENYIRIKADDGYRIKRILVNGEEIEIENDDEMILPNFIDVHNHNEIIASFESIMVPDVPKTSANTQLKIIGFIGLIISLAVIVCYLKVRKTT